MHPPSLSAFRLGDVRGIYPDEIDEAFARRFAQAFVERFRITGCVATGRDMRGSSASLQQALNDALVACGLDVADLGLCTTELGYFASTRGTFEATIIVTASHNPERYNGFKCVLQNGEAVTFDTGLSEVMQLMMSSRPTPQRHHGSIRSMDLLPAYMAFLGRRFDFGKLGHGKLALNGLNGTAATLAADIADRLSWQTSWFRKDPGPIPAQGADPGQPQIAAEMKGFMQQDDFSLGVAWDGDCDRCVFFDNHGDVIPTYFMVGLFAGYFLDRRPGSTVVFDSKLCWNTLDIIKAHGGKAVRSPTGHAFMKRNMREHCAVYGGELSSHHFFGDFFYCDSGMMAWLTALELTSRHDGHLADLVAMRREDICCTPEINLRLSDSQAAFAAVRSDFASRAVCTDHFDGLSMEMPGGWRFSLTQSKTEPLVRLNMESREGSQRLLTEGVQLLRMLQPFTESSEDLLQYLVIQ